MPEELKAIVRVYRVKIGNRYRLKAEVSSQPASNTYVWGGDQVIPILLTPNTPTKLAPPVLTVSQLASTTTVRLTWPAVSGALQYVIERQIDGGGWTALTTVPGLMLDVPNNTVGTTHEFRARAKNNDPARLSDLSNVPSIVIAASGVTPPPAPQNAVMTTISDSEILLEAQPVASAQHYEAHISVSSGFVPTTATRVGGDLTSPSILATGLPADTQHYGVIIAVGDAGLKSDPSNEATARTDPIPLAAPVLAVVNGGSNSNDVSLTTPTLDADFYEVARQFLNPTIPYEDEEPWPIIVPDWNGAPFTDSGLFFDPADYNYRVRAVRDGVLSAWSNVVFISMPVAPANPPGAPVMGGAAEISVGVVDVSVVAGANATHHDIYRDTADFTPPGGGTKLNSSALSAGNHVYRDEGVPTGSPLFYKSLAVNADGSTPAANAAVITPSEGEEPPPPQPPTAPVMQSAVEVGSGQGIADVTWQEGSGADAHDIHRIDGANDFMPTDSNKIGTDVTSPYRDFSAGAGRTRSYKTRARNSVGGTPASNFKFLTLSPSAPPPSEFWDYDRPGQIQILDDPLSSDTGWAVRSGTPQYVLDQFDDPISPPGALKFFFPQGHFGNEAPFIAGVSTHGVAERSFTPRRAVKLDFVFWLDKYMRGVDGDNKLAFLKAGDKPHCYVQLVHAGGSGESTASQGLIFNIGTHDFDQPFISVDTQVSLQCSAFNKIQFIVVASSSPSQNDGELYCKANNTVVIERTGLPIASNLIDNAGLYPQMGNDVSSEPRPSGHTVLFTHCRLHYIPM